MSSSITPDFNWHTLQEFPFNHCSKPFAMNGDEFMVAAHKTSLIKGDGIYKFNIHKNEWIKIFNYNTHLQIFEPNIHLTAYDKNNQLLHIASGRQMAAFDLKNNKMTVKEDQQYELSVQLIFADNRLHQICQRGDHYVYDKTNKFQKLTTFNALSGIEDQEIIYMKSKKSILAFGAVGFFPHNPITNTRPYGMKRSIYQFSCPDSQWTELNIKTPTALCGCGLVVTTNERYIIILGGKRGLRKGYYADAIFIYDIRNNVFVKSKIKCPEEAEYNAILMKDSKRTEMITFGFVRDCYKAETFVGIQSLPQYVILNIVCCYFCIEEIYLLKRNSGLHWKINVDCILQS